MADYEKIKLTFTKVHVYRDADDVGSGNWYFIAKVDNLPVGNHNQIFNAEEGRSIPLPQGQWETTINVRGRNLNSNPVIVRFQVKDSDFISDEDLGTSERQLRMDVRQGYYDTRTDRSQYFRVHYKVELMVMGRFGFHLPEAVFATRQHPGSVSCTTVSGRSFMARMEICPVIPIPADPSLPRRPLIDDHLKARNIIRHNGIEVTPNDPINIIPNPSAIPILDPADANANTAARIEFTYYHPGTLRFTDDDPRLEWSIVPIQPSVPAGGVVSGSARFLGPGSTPDGLHAHGTGVLVYGTAEGEVRLEMRFQGALFATYRALILPVRQIRYRANILNGPGRSQPRSRPGHVRDHIAIANRFLRQMAIELVPDNDVTVTDGARPAEFPGIFRISVTRGITREVPITRLLRPTRLNYRQGIFNLAYIHSTQPIRRRGARPSYPLGLADSFLASLAGDTIIDNGRPSTSWIIPSGIPPDGEPREQRMALLRAREQDPARFPQLFAMCITNQSGDPDFPGNQLTYGSTIAHELGHALNLHHRNVGGPDRLNSPPDQNIMHPDEDADVAQDFDIIQTRAARQSRLVQP